MIIENILYINLDKRLDKKKWIESQLESAPKHIPIYRIPGVILDKNTIDEKFFTKTEELIHNKQIFANTTGCFLAHKNAINTILNCCNKNPKNYSLIIEDDIYIESGFWSNLSSISCSKDVDILFFDNYIENNSNRHLNQLYKIDKNNSDFKYYVGAFCYAIRHNRLIKIFNKLNRNFNNKKPIYIDHVDIFLYSTKNIETYSTITNTISVNYDLISDRLSQ